MESPKIFGIGECGGLGSVLEISLLQLCGGWAGGEKPEAVQRLDRSVSNYPSLGGPP